jgi:hypothetical protein
MAHVIMMLFLFLFYGVQAKETSVFYYSNACVEAQKHIAALRLNKAAQILSDEKKAQPNNAAVLLLENYIDFYRIVTSLDYSTFKDMEQQKSARLNAFKTIPENSPFHLYAQSELHLQFAFAKAMREEYVGAMFEFRSAYNLANDNLKKFPSFLPSQKTVGMFSALLGTTGKSYKWVLNIAGLRGNFNEGLALLEKYFEKKVGDEFVLDKQFAVFYYALLQLNYGDKQLAWKFCKDHTADYASSLMSCYLRGYTGMRTAQKEEAIEVFAARPKSSEYQKFDALEFYYALCKLYRLDHDADKHFKHFIANTKTKVLVKEAYRWLAWYYLVNNDYDKHVIYAGLMKRHGSRFNEEEKNMLYEIDKKISPDAIVLKARLLYDGGYYQRAEDMIASHPNQNWRSDYQKQEYYYRYARIMEAQHKLSKASEYYQLVIKNSSENTPYHFAPFASFYQGLIYKQLGFTQLAKSYLNNVSKYSKAEYAESIQIRAQNALQQIK